jgi:hypothetical protein
MKPWQSRSGWLGIYPCPKRGGVWGTGNLAVTIVVRQVNCRAAGYYHRYPRAVVETPPGQLLREVIVEKTTRHLVHSRGTTSRCC